MFYPCRNFYRSTLLDRPRLVHGFSTRYGGHSTLPPTASLNLSYHLGDPDAVVRANIDTFVRALSDNRYGGDVSVSAHQIHSARVRLLTAAEAGEGYNRPAGEEADGFVTDCPGIVPFIRVADCVPILLTGTKPDASPVIGAVHAGWRGTVSGIAPAAVEAMVSLGCMRDSIRVAIGTHIGFCCYEVGDDFIEQVTRLCGEAFAARHIRQEPGMSRPHADLTGMNLERLAEAGISPEQADVSPFCTMCDPVTWYSHRASGGKRGVMGAGVAILPPFCIS